MSGPPSTVNRQAIQVVSSGGAAARFRVVVHGGAGDVPEAKRAGHVEGCRAAARAGADVLRRGGSALDAAEVAVRVLEDDPRFNAGTGACLNEAGRIETDASIMEGRGLGAGAVCALRGFANPIAIARAALDDGRHVLYAAEGAAEFARARGFTPVDEERMVTEAARAALERFRQGASGGNWAGGTVGAVVRDAMGLVVAATSTGGMVGKRAGRVGDTPIIGAGTYADDDAGAVSTTGHGEAMIRLTVARMTVEHMRAGESPEAAARRALTMLAARLGAQGGLIAIGRDGSFGIARSTTTMSWATVSDASEDAGT